MNDDIGGTAFISDIHLQEGAKLQTIGQALHQAFKICAEREVSRVVLSGDVFDDPRFGIGRSSTGGDLLYALLEPIRQYGQMFEVDAFPGNHDMEGPSNHHALECLRGFPRVNVIDTPCVRRYSGLTIAYIPWAWNTALLTTEEARGMSQEDFIDHCYQVRRRMLQGITADWYEDRGLKICTGHGEIDGAKNRYIELPPGRFHVFQMADLWAMKADAYAWGHYHGRQLDMYVGSLCQLAAGEEGNPTGFLIVHRDGRKEWIDVESPRYYTVRTVAELEMLGAEPTDVVKFMAEEKPSYLPPGVRFAKIPQKAEHRTRTENLRSDSPTRELLAEWHALTSPKTTLEAILPLLDTCMAENPETHAKAAPSGSIEAIRRIRLQNIGPHVDTTVEVQENEDGMIAIVGRNGCGKTLLLEALVAVFEGRYPFYDTTLYDMVPKDFQGTCSAEVVFDANGGKRYLAIRRYHLTPKTRNLECLLFELIPGQPDREMAGPKEADFQDRLQAIIGDIDILMAVALQNQDDKGDITSLPAPKRMDLARRWFNADRYTTMHEWAKQGLSGLGMRVKLMQQELNGKPDLEDQQTDLESELSTVKVSLNMAKTLRNSAVEVFEAASKTLEQMAIARAAEDEKRAMVDQLAKEDQRCYDGLEKLKLDIAGLRKKLDQRPALVAQVAELEGLRQKLQEAKNSEALSSEAYAHQKAKATEVLAVKHEYAALRNQIRAEVDKQWAQHEHGVKELERSKKDLQTSINKEKSRLESEREASAVHLTMLKEKKALLSQAGCGPDFLVCGFISNAVEARNAIAAAEAQYLAVSTKIRDNDFSLNERTTIGEVDLAISALRHEMDVMKAVGPDLDMGAVDAWTEAESTSEALQALAAKGKALLAELEAIVIPTCQNSDIFERRIGEIKMAEQALGALDEVGIQLEQLESTVPQAEAQAASAKAVWQKAYNELPVDDRGEFLLMQTEAAVAREDIARTEEQVNKLMQQVGVLTGRIEGIQEQLNKLQPKQNILLELLAEIPAHEALCDFLHPSGAPQLLIDLSLPRINDLLAEILNDMNDDRWQIEFKTQRTLKGGGKQEGLWIDVTDTFGTRDITLHSGGEKVFLRKTIRLALGMFEVERAGQHHQIYLMDEPMKGVDSEWVDAFMAGVYKLLSRFKQVWMVEHNPVMLAACPKIIELKRLSTTGPTFIVGSEVPEMAAV